MRVGKLAAALRGEGKERARAAFDVDPAILACRAGLIVQLVQLFLARHDREAERLDHARPLMEGELAKRRTTDFAGVLEHRAEIESTGARQSHRRAVDRTHDLGSAVTRDPAVALVIQQLGSLHGALIATAAASW